MTDRRWRIALVVVAVLAAAVRVGMTAVTQGLANPPRADANPDSFEYERFAANLAAGSGYALDPPAPSACRPPGTPFLLAPVYLLFGHNHLAARLWVCLLSAVTCPLTCVVGARLFDRRVGLLAGLWLSVYPGHWYYALHFLSEGPTGLGVLLGGWAAWEAARGGSWKAAALAGLAWGFTVLVRPNMAVAVGVAGVVLLLARTQPFKVRLRNAALLSVASALVVLPWVVRNHFVMGKATVCTVVGGATFYGANNPQVYADGPNVGYWVPVSELDRLYPEQSVGAVADETEKDRIAYANGRRFADEFRGDLPRVFVHHVLRVVWAYNESPENRTADLLLRGGWFVTLLPFAVGLVVAWRRHPLAAAVMTAGLAATLVTAVAFYGCSRFRDAVAPALGLFAAVGVAWVWDVMRERFRRVGTAHR